MSERPRRSDVRGCILVLRDACLCIYVRDPRKYYGDREAELKPATLSFTRTSHAARIPFETPQAPWHFLYFLPLPHQHGSLRPT
jgi:hypothetical protein